jgi:hypothetical protein
MAAVPRKAMDSAPTPVFEVLGLGLRVPATTLGPLLHSFARLTRGNRVPNPREWAPSELVKGIKYLVIGDHYIGILGLIGRVY